MVRRVVLNAGLVLSAVTVTCVMGVGPGAADAAAPNPFRQSAPAMTPDAALVPGTYTWVGDRSTLGAITFSAGHTWTSTFDSDSGEWVQSGKSFAMDMTGGSDGAAGCLFAAKVGPSGTSLVNGTFSCSVTGYSGIWSASPAANTAPGVAHDDVFARRGVAPSTSIVPGAYKWFIDSQHEGTITYAAANTWSSTYESDGGYWDQAGKNIAMAMTSGTDGTAGCIFAGKVATTGKAIGSASAPGAWICPGYGTTGTWYVR